MSNGLNKCEFIGNLGADAEMQTTPSGAAAVAAYLTKGKQVFVAGRFQTNTSEKDRQKRYFTSINVKDLLLLGSRGHGEYPAPAQQQTNGEYSDEDYQVPGGDDGFPF